MQRYNPLFGLPSTAPYNIAREVNPWGILREARLQGANLEHK